MSDAKPVIIRKGMFGNAWYAVRGPKPGPGSTVQYSYRAQVENGDYLTQMEKLATWAMDLLEATGKTGDEIMAHCGVPLDSSGPDQEGKNNE